MTGHRIYRTPFAKVYPLHLQKVERKNRTRAELDQVVRCLDKLVDELAKGKAMDKILRKPAV